MSFIKRNILFVDDDPMSKTMVSTMLTQAGYIVTCVSDGFEALDHLERYAFDFIILDIMMTKMNGLDLLKRLKSQPNTQDIPVMMLSARDEQKIVERARAMGAEDYMVKPPQREILLKKVETLLGGRPRFAELHLPAQSEKAKCQFIFEGRILSIGESGITFASSIPLDVDQIQQIASPLFQEIGLIEPKLKVAHCIPEKEGFTIYVNFVGLKTREVRAVREWVIENVLKVSKIA